MLITDSQIHPYAPRAAGAIAPAGQRILTPDAIITAMDGAGVRRAVLVPPRVDLSTTNEYAVRAAKRWPDRLGVMGKLLLDRPESPAIAAAWTRGDLLGFRISFPRGQASPADATWLWSAAEARDFPVMVWAPGQLGELEAAARQHPRVRIVVDHLGMAPEDVGDRARASIREVLALAALDNVAVKASSLPAHSELPFPFTDLHEPVREVVRAFGPRRVFWGSDLTTLTCDYDDAVRMFTDAMNFDAIELDEIMGSAISRWLRWKV